MTDYFEVKERDGPARIGLLLQEITTPHVLDASQDGGAVVDGGSVYQHGSIAAAQEYVENRAQDDELLILPYRPLPYAAPAELVEEYHTEWDVDVSPGGLVVHPKYRGEVGLHDLYVLGGAREMEQDPRALTNAIRWLRENTPADTALYAPALATPENLPLLVYLGVDVVDDVLARIRAYRGRYMMPDGEHPLDKLRELPCLCPSCRDRSPEDLLDLPAGERGRLVAEHNRWHLENEMRVIRERIRLGRMREYVEGRARSSPWLTAILRLADQEYTYLERRAPVARLTYMYANTMESIQRPEVQRYGRRVLERYQAPAAEALIILPCSARKPYSTSQTHQQYRRAIGNRDANELIITSPLGIVPRELELTYPAAHYDVPVTGYWDLEEQRWIKSQLRDYLRENPYERIVVHVDGAPLEICRELAGELGLSMTYTGEQGPTARESLQRLSNAVEDLPRGNREEGRRSLMRAIADYQFGTGAGDLLLENRGRVTSPYPKHRLETDEGILATLVPEYGLLALTLEGARRLEPLTGYWVEIGEFVPRGSVLAPGVLDADERIRPMDEVIIYGERAFGVGRAQMSGWEMRESTRGVSVDVKHIEEL